MPARRSSRRDFLRQSTLLGVGLGLWGSTARAAGLQSDTRIAFLSDVHFHDVYATFNDNAFAGIEGPDGRRATIRTMGAQLRSTRLFNENYFAFEAALASTVARGAKWIVLPGDFSDDGQPVHIRGLLRLLAAHEARHSVRFFATFGNHDPVRPFTTPGGKTDFLGTGGRTQPIHSEGSRPGVGELPPIQSEELRYLGYAELIEAFSPHGLAPRPEDLYWETPFSMPPEPAGWSYAKARADAALERRTFPSGGRAVPDGSYLVEPEEGLWLLSLDTNVYPPDPSRPGVFGSSSNTGFNALATAKPYLLTWAASVADRARALGKQLITFSHFPAIDALRGTHAAIGALFGDASLRRQPSAAASSSLLTQNIPLHLGGHLHVNATGVHRPDPAGPQLVHVHIPSLAAYVPAYKLVTLSASGVAEVDTVELNDVPGFDSLFPHYATELAHLQATSPSSAWKGEILKARSYREFTDGHLSELTRLRFLPTVWPAGLARLLTSWTARDVLTLVHLETSCSPAALALLPDHAHPRWRLLGPESGAAATQATFAPARLEADWSEAEAAAGESARRHGLSLASIDQVPALELAVDFYRCLNAGSLAGPELAPRRALHEVLSDRLGASASEETANVGGYWRQRLRPLAAVWQSVAKAVPDRRFRVDLRTGALSPA